jgi:hypothetical protein
MNIELHEITVRQLVAGYRDDSINEGGIVGYGGKLDIRPKYQREFVYDDKQREAVIQTITRNFPLNVMYWVKKSNTEDEYEIIDGQQRTISICQYVIGVFSVLDANGHPKAFFNLIEAEQNQILDYKLMVYFCEGTDVEKLNWFKTINIAGEKLTEQELRNAIYTGPWLTNAKRHFSKTGCVAYSLGKDYVKGSPIKQELLEKALCWISNDNVKSYMATHQNDPNCSELWQYFQQVINWVKILFPSYRKDMKGIEWGYVYNEYKDKTYDSQSLEARYQELIVDDEVDSRTTKGIYLYLVTGNQKYLSLRAFTPRQKQVAFENQKGVCPSCGNTFTFEQMEGDHIIPWSQGGKTTQENCQMLCKKCNGQKSSS